METVKVNKNNLASIIMGKNISFPWRGQRDLLISVPYNEWLKFIKENRQLIGNRRPLDYSRMLDSKDENMKIRYFYYEMSWALFSELSCSSNVNKDATLILPYFDDGINIDIMEVINEANKIDSASFDKYHSNLKASTRNYFSMLDDADLSYGLVDVKTLSPWNVLIFKICIYLQSKSSNKIVTEKLNIDWRLS